MIAISVPLPPTSNHRLVPIGGRQVKSPEYRAWMNQAAWLIRSQLTAQKHYEALSTEVFVRVAVTFPDRRKRDLDNVLKPLNDVLVQAGVIKDDSLIKFQSIYRNAINKEDARVEAFIYQDYDEDASVFRQVMSLSTGAA